MLAILLAVLAAVDHYSRQVVAAGVFANKPDCRTACQFLGRSFRQRRPKYIICDRDAIFDCGAFRAWVKRNGIKPPRYGAIGKHHSIAVIERFFRTFKSEFARRVTIPMHEADFRRDVSRYVAWFNEHRPHTTLDGRTPNEGGFTRAQARACGGGGRKRPRLLERGGAGWYESIRCLKVQVKPASRRREVIRLRSM
ncbi:MAG: integrase core domain-containing protein [Pirellulaceae bacterium]|jgi:transposase InsO family protein|nr:integrase core domain-containing protein [Pirellulaceae bacterium]